LRIIRDEGFLESVPVLKVEEKDWDACECLIFFIDNDGYEVIWQRIRLSLWVEAQPVPLPVDVVKL
jgi:hypothetical protein